MIGEPTVLIVDDEPNILKALTRILSDDGYAITVAATPQAALDLLRSRHFAVIVSDNMMPGMSGIELLEQAKVASPDSVRIMLTGHADAQTAIDAINRGEVYRFIAKPWETEAVRETVRDAANRSGMIRSLRRGDEATLRSLAQTIELKDSYTRGHCDRVAAYALKLAGALGIDEERKRQIKYGCWLHDCGKIGVPEAILNYNGPLSPEQLAVMQKHPQWGADVARQARLPEAVVNIILHHHEKYGGGGYPAGVKGEAIPLEARIVAVADVYDALATDRPYRKGFDKEKTMNIMTQMTAEGELDPRLFDLFTGILRAEAAGKGGGHD